MVVRPAELMVRNSEQSSFKTCRQMWHWGYGLRLKPNAPSSPLTFGTYIHACLERYYKPGTVRGPHPAITARRLHARYMQRYGRDLPRVKISGEDEWGEPNYVDAVDLAVIVLEGYVERWLEDKDYPDSRYEVISSEMTFQIDINDDRGKYLFTAVGTCDGLWRDLHTGKLIFLETKTGTGLEPFGAPTPLDEQSGFYISFCNLWLRAMGMIGPLDEVDYVLFNRLAKKTPDGRATDEQGRALNKNGSVSKRQPPPRFKRELVYRGHDEQVNFIERMRQESREMRLVRAGKLDVYKNPGRHCNWCDFGPNKGGMCEVHECGQDYLAIAEEMFHEWAPYSAHELKQERRGS